MKEKTTLAALMLGGNQGDTRYLFTRAISLLNRYAGVVTASSALYASEPWGMPDQPRFLNQALLLCTALPAGELLEQTQRIERELGRKKGIPNGPRPIDIDILLIGDLVWKAAGLEIPHPRMHLRQFNLVPLSEIAGDWIHPIFGKTVRELSHSCSDPLTVIKINADETERGHQVPGY